MPEIFPISATFPGPNWIEEPQLSVSASAKTIMLNGAVSALRFSDVQSGGSINCRWDEMTEAQLTEFRAFWRLVDMIGSFTLPSAFFRPEWPAARVAAYQAISETGYWRFEEKPKWADMDLYRYQVSAVITASLT